MKEKEIFSRKQFIKNGAALIAFSILGKFSEKASAEENSTYMQRDCWSTLIEPDLTGYVEITELTYHNCGRKADSGEFDENLTDYPSIGDVFYTPLGTDIILTSTNKNIKPYIQGGEDFLSLINQGIINSHICHDFFWYHCKLTDVCCFMGVYYDVGNGVHKIMTENEFLKGNLHLYIRFPGKAINTKWSAKIRTIDMQKAYQRLFTVVHLTDTHGDMDSTHAAYEYAGQIAANCVALTGDYVPNMPSHGFNMLHSVIRNSKIPTIYSIGNHDVIGLSDKEVYDLNIAPIREVLHAAKDHAYYYRDFRYEEETIRMISLYPFYEKANSRQSGYYTEEQLQWFCDALATAEEGAHIFVLRHFAHHKPILRDTKKDMFFDYSDDRLNEESSLWLNMGSDPITEIVDAFNNRSVIFAQYSGKLKDTTEFVTVKYDFSNRTNSEFVAYFTGHIHIDAIGYARNTQTSQAVLCSLCTIGWKGTENYSAYTTSSTPRDYGTDSQIAFNVFTFNFKKKMIYVARVGNGLHKTREKTIMELPYSSTQVE